MSALIVALGAEPCCAGPVTGQVVDPDGRGVPGAAVILTDGTAVVARTLTLSSGQFTLNVPDSGHFEVRVALDGFRGKPVAVTGASAERDLGTIALEISAVSESVVVSAAQVEIPLSAASSSVTVITRDDLEKHQVETVADALRAVPGLSVVANGGRGAVTCVFPRGGESDYSLVFVDGVQANAFGGGFDFAHLPVANIERIEIVRGPQSALFGSNAIGAVVRIITRQAGGPTRRRRSKAAASIRSVRPAATSGTVGNWHWGAVTERLTTRQLQRRSAPRPERSSRTTTTSGSSATAAGGWRNSQGAALRGNVQYATDERGSPGPFGSDPGGTYGGIDTVSRGINDRWLMSIVRRRADRPRTRQRRREPLAARQRVRQSVRRFRVVLAAHDRARRRRTRRWRTASRPSAGVEFLGERAAAPSSPRRATCSCRSSAAVAGFFGEGRWNYGARLFVTAGVRVDRITREPLDGDADAFSPRPTFPSDTVVSANPKVSAAWFLGADRRQRHQAARLGRHRHPAARRLRDRVHRQPVARAGAQPQLRCRASSRPSSAGAAWSKPRCSSTTTTT